MGISTKFTHADFLQLPGDRRYEIVDGEVLATLWPYVSHQRIVGRCLFPLLLYLKQHPLGVAFTYLDVILSDHDVLEPDIVVVLNERRNILQDWIRGTPDIVIEVLSSSTAGNDRGPKLKAYARFGVSEYWIVDPNARAIEAYRLGKEGYEPPRIFREQEDLTSLALPGFVLPVGKVFEPD
ncbi:MAG TPA: Uma2 family endonuclease [Terriglobia bacterium]|nr:Uma2 family endonuclease [Terriglobia bacterium]